MNETAKPDFFSLAVLLNQNCLNVLKIYPSYVVLDGLSSGNVFEIQNFIYVGLTGVLTKTIKKNVVKFKDVEKK